MQQIFNDMYKEILEQLKTKFSGVSEKILDRIAKKLAETVTKSEDVKTAVDGVTFQKVLESYGDSRATDATKTAVLNYEKKHGLKDGQKVDTATQQQQQVEIKPDETAPAWAQALANSVKTLTEKVETIQTERVASTRKQQMSEVLSKLPENLRKGYERISLEDMDDEAFKTLLADVTGEVGEIAKDTSAKGAAFGVPTSPLQGVQSQTQEASDDQVAAVVSQFNI